MQLPYVLNEIMLQLGVAMGVLNFPVGFQESLNAVRVSRWLHTATNIVIEELQVQAPLIFDDHVVKNDTTCHCNAPGFFPKLELPVILF